MQQLSKKPADANAKQTTHDRIDLDMSADDNFNELDLRARKLVFLKYR